MILQWIITYSKMLYFVIHLLNKWIINRKVYYLRFISQKANETRFPIIHTDKILFIRIEVQTRVACKDNRLTFMLRINVILSYINKHRATKKGSRFKKITQLSERLRIWRKRSYNLKYCLVKKSQAQHQNSNY